MDLILRFWDKENNRVVSRYIDSVFLGYTRAVDLLENFFKGLASLGQANMVQVSMNGPLTNLKFNKQLVQQRNSEDIPMLLNICLAAASMAHESSTEDRVEHRSFYV